MSVFGTVAYSDNSGAGSAYTTVTSLNTATGDLIIVGVAINDTSRTIGTPTDTARNIYVPLTLRNVPLGGGLLMQYFYCLSAIANAANLIFGTLSGSATYEIAVWDVPITGTAAFDVESSWGASFNSASAAFTTTGTDEFVAEFAFDAWGGFTYTAGTGYTLDNGQITPVAQGAAQHRQFSSVQTGITAAFGNTPGGGGHSAAIAVAFKAGAPPAGPIAADIAGTGVVTATLTATGALASVIRGSASVSANLVNIGLVASISGRASLTALLKALGPLNAGISGQASLSANLKARADLAATILGRAGVTADIIGFVVDQIRSDISGRGSVVAFPTIPPAKTYFPPNNPRGRQSPPYVLKEFGVTLSNPAYLATNQNTVQLFHQTSFVPNVNAGSVLPPRWSTPGTPDNQGYQGRAQAPGELLVAPDNLRLSGKVYTVVAQGMVFIPTSAVNPTFNLVMSQNYFRFGQAQVINTLFTLANPTSLVPGTMNGWTLIATLAGNGVSTPVISCAGRLWIGGTQYYGNGFSINPPETTSGKSHPSYRREPIVQLSLGVQFGGQVSGSDMFQAFLGKFQMGYNTNNNSF